MKRFIIDKNGAGQRLDRFMQKVMPSVSAGGVYKALRKKKVRVNGKHKEGLQRLCEGDVVELYINDEFFETGEKTYPWMSASSVIRVVYEDENILIADKPSGMPSQDLHGEEDSLESRIRAYLYRKGEINLCAVPIFVPSLCHRIDRNTSGLLIAAKNSAAQRVINQKIKDKEVRKFYLCRTEGTPEPQCGRIVGYLLKDEKKRRMVFYTEPASGAVRCETAYKTLRAGRAALVEAELLTGRTHQIRVCFAHIGCPLVGDVKYGARKDGEKGYQQLHAYKLVFDFKTDSGALEYLKGKTVEI